MPTFEDRNRPLWQGAADSFGRVVKKALILLHVYYFDRVSRERYGVATGLDVPNRRVSIRATPVSVSAGAPASPIIRAAYGRPTWTAGQIVGKRVRFWATDQIVEGPEGPVVQDTLYVVDDVLE